MQYKEEQYLITKKELINLGFSNGMSEALIPAFGKKLLPNPTVGASLIDENDELILSAAHEGKGTAHAEFIIIKKINELQIDTRNCSLFVTLEPCMHEDTSPSCAKLIADSKLFNKIIIGDIDPDTRTNGMGLLYLRNLGIDVDIEIGATSFIDPSYFSFVQNLHPYTISKFGVTKNWSTFSSMNKNKYITSDYSRKLGHILRSNVDAILIGKNTLITDQPQLNIRYDLGTADPLGIVLWGSDLKSDEFTHYYKKYSSFLFICSSDKSLSELNISFGDRERIILINNQEITSKRIFDSFKELKVNSFLLEGGLITWKLFDSSIIKSNQIDNSFNSSINKMYIFESSAEFDDGDGQYLDKHYINNKYTLINNINHSEDSLYIYERRNT